METPREPLKCLGCSGPHRFRNCPYSNNRKVQIVNNLQEVLTLNDIARKYTRD